MEKVLLPLTQDEDTGQEVFTETKTLMLSIDSWVSSVVIGR